MKHLHALATLLFLSTASLAQNPVFQWGDAVGNIAVSEFQTNRGIAVADDGAAYVVGGRAGGPTIIENIVADRAYLARFASTGHCLWARSAPGGASVTTVGTNAIYVAGSFDGTIDFGGTTLTANGEDAYLARFDANGDLVWVRQMGGSLTDQGHHVEVDGLGQVHIAGTFQGSATFGITTLVATHTTTGFLSTYDAAGNFLWAKLTGGAESLGVFDGYSSAIGCDAAGRTYVLGSFNGTATFGGITATSSSDSDLFLARYESNGTCMWVEQENGTSMSATDVTVSPNGNIYAYGGYRGAAVFGSGVLLNGGGAEIFLAHYDPSGASIWAVNAGHSVLNNGSNSMTLDSDGNAWLTGYISGDGIFGGITLPGPGEFVARYNGTGTCEMAIHLTDGSLVSSYIDLDPSDHIYLTGEFSNAMIFDLADPVTVNSARFNISDAYLVRYDATLNYEWHRTMHNHASAFDSGNGVVADPGGNVHTIGTYNGSAIACTDTLHEFLAATAILLAKNDANGACVWNKSIGTIGSSSGNAITIDGNGDLYVTGTFTDSIQFGTTWLTSAGEADLYLAKLDANGNVLWAKRGGGAGNETSLAVNVDASGNVYIAGSYTGSCTIGSTTFTSLGNTDGYLAKYDNTGTNIWARSMGGNAFDNTNGLTVDDAGNSYMTGRFTTAANFGSLNVSGTNAASMFIAKYDTGGDPVWANATTSSDWIEGRGLDWHSNGQVYVTGHFRGSADVGGIAFTGDPLAFRPFLAAYTDAGSIAWAQEFATVEGYGAAVAVRPAGDVVLSGSFGGSIMIGSISLTSTGLSDALLASFDANGQSLWAVNMGGNTGNDYNFGNALATDANTIHLTGSFGNPLWSYDIGDAGNIIFEPGNPASLFTATNDIDMFVVRYDVDESVSIAEVGSSPIHLVVAPNPADRFFTLKCDAPLLSGSSITVRDMTGRSVPVTFTARAEDAIIDASDLPLGAYTITMRTENGSATARFMKQ